MILIHFLTWGTMLFCAYVIAMRLWWCYLDNRLEKLVREHHALEFAHYSITHNRNITPISLSERLIHKVIYFPCVYKGRAIQIITSEYQHKSCERDLPGLHYQHVILN